MKPLSLLVYATSVVIITAVSLQAQMGPPTPAPETKKLELLAGDWTAQGTMTAGPPGTPESKWTMNTHAEWMQGNFFLVEHSDLDMAGMGKGTEIAFLGYDPDKKVYTYHAFNSWGEAESATGTVEGDTWTWTSDEHMGGRTMKGRYTMKVLSPTSYTMKFELSPDGNQWNTGMEGKATKK
jgi:Protein of unknown function (DUF1579)